MLTCENCGKRFRKEHTYQLHLVKNKACSSFENDKMTDEDTYICQNEPKYTFIELAAGAGGLSSGLMKAGFTPLLLNDNNKDCCATLALNHPDANVVCGSMTEIDYNEYIGKVDLLTGGVPCQSFSNAGSRKGLEDPRGDLMMKFIEILNIIKPRVFMVENVKGLTNHNKGETLKTIIKTMNESGNQTFDDDYQFIGSLNSKYKQIGNAVPCELARRIGLSIINILKPKKDF